MLMPSKFHIAVVGAVVGIGVVGLCARFVFEPEKVVGGYIEVNTDFF